MFAPECVIVLVTSECNVARNSATDAKADRRPHFCCLQFRSAQVNVKTGDVYRLPETSAVDMPSLRHHNAPFAASLQPPLRILMSEVTRILDAIQNGDQSATEELLPLVYEELRRLASAKMSKENPGHTLSATALVHEAYVRLVGTGTETEWNGKGHFFGAAAQTMRRILIENARRKGRLKHGAEFKREELHDSQFGVSDPDGEILAVHESLERFADVEPKMAQLVELRYFAGLTSAEAAKIQGISKATADRNWAYARAWLRRDIGEDQ